MVSIGRLVILIFFILSFNADLEAKIPTISTSDFNPAILKIEEEKHLGRSVAEITFTDKSRKEFSISQFKGKVLILTLVYYDCPHICPLLVEGLFDALNEIRDLKNGKDYHVLILSFNSKDTPSKALEFYERVFNKKRSEVFNQWKFATTTDENINKLVESTGYRFFYSIQDGMFVHPSVYIFISPEGRITRYLYGSKPDPFNVRLAILESMKGISGSVSIASMITFACYKYDPGSRTYVINIPLLFIAAGIFMGVITGLLSIVIYVKKRRSELLLLIPFITFISGKDALASDASNPSRLWDQHFGIYLILMFAVWLVVTIPLIYICIRYRKGRGREEGDYIEGNSLVEIIWTVIPLVIVIFLGIQTWSIYQKFRGVPSNAYEISVEGFMWGWNVTYPEGIKGVNEIVIPAGIPVRISLTSRDVLHGFFLPDFHIQEEAIPGRITYLWFNAEKPGLYRAFCTEFCGNGHSMMIAKVIAMKREDFNAWISKAKSEGEALPDINEGRRLVEILGCLGCHTVTGEESTGPTFKGIFGRETRFEDGGSMKVDEEYIEHSILYPSEKIVKGYPAAMPPYRLSERQIYSIIAYLKSLK